MPSIKYDDLSDDLQATLAKLEVEVEELRFESNIYRWAALVTFIIAIERIWSRFF